MNEFTHELSSLSCLAPRVSLGPVMFHVELVFLDSIRRQVVAYKVTLVTRSRLEPSGVSRPHDNHRGPHDNRGLLLTLVDPY